MEIHTGQDLPVEAARIAFLYRRAVLDLGHFASTPEYRRRFLASCADFRRWLAAHDERIEP